MASTGRFVSACASFAVSSGIMAVQSWSNRRRWLSVAGPLLLVAIATPLVMTTNPCPFGVLGLLLTCWCLWTAFVFRRTSWWIVNLGAVLFALSLVEVFLYWRLGTMTAVRLPVRGSPLPVEEHTDQWGRVPRPNARISHSLVVGGTTIFDTVYSFDSYGLRVMPTPASVADPDVVVFFGCSFTFGDGVGDQETLPARVAACAPELQVLNFAYSGYGPHQMLANLESGRVCQIVPKAPRVVIFQMIPDQVRRARGWIRFNPHAPRYVFAESRVRREGNLDDAWWTPQVWPFVWQSRIFERLLVPRLVGQADLDLTAALIRQSADEVQRQFPGCEFHILLWNHPDQRLAVPLRRELCTAGIRIHDVERIILDLKKRPEKYRIPYDSHPNSETHRLLAEYVCREILGELQVAPSDH